MYKVAKIYTNEVISVEKVLFTDVGEGLHEAEILQWFVDVGDTVERDGAIVELQTDKVAIEVTAPKKGVIRQRAGEIGDKVIVGDMLVEVDTGKGQSESAALQVETKPLEAPPQPEKTTATTTVAKGPSRVKAAPSVRKLARSLNIDIQQVTPSAPHGRITKQDVLSMSAEPQTEQQATATIERREVTTKVSVDRREKINGVRKQMFKNIAASLANIPHTTAMHEMQVDEVIALREELKPFTTAPLTYLPLFIKMTAHTLKQHPIFNASIDEEKEEIIYHEGIHLGIAMATQQGLVVPVMHNVEQLTLEEIADQLADLTARGRENKLALHELKGATFTISSTGMRGGVYATPVMTAPQVAIMSLHAMTEKPVILKDRTIGIGTMMGASLSFDHRIIDGEAVGLFMETFKRYVENPSTLLLKS